MAIHPLAITDEGIDIYHGERNHGGTVRWEDVAFLTRPDGVVDQRFLVLPCPVAGCDSHSVHPVGGGSHPEAVQTLFVHLYHRHPDVDADTREVAHALARERCSAMDGPERWQLGDTPDLAGER